MATNPYINKVEFDGDTLMDLTGDTASPSDVLLGKTFHDRSGAPQTGTLDPYQVNDTAETTIDDADYFPFYDTSASGKRKSLWSNIKSVLKTFFDGYYHPLTTVDENPTSGSSNLVKSGGVYSKMVHEITRTVSSAAANSQVRIPASGTDSRISTANTCIVKPICQTKSDGTPYKFKSCVVSAGYATITVSEALSNVTIGVEVVNI